MNEDDNRMMQEQAMPDDDGGSCFCVGLIVRLAQD
jgi:hypothetical protein